DPATALSRSTRRLRSAEIRNLADLRRRGAHAGIDGVVSEAFVAACVAAIVAAKPWLIVYSPGLNAGIAQLVERNLAKVEVGSSRLLSRSTFPRKRLATSSRELSQPFLFSSRRGGRVVMQRP